MAVFQMQVQKAIGELVAHIPVTADSALEAEQILLEALRNNTQVASWAPVPEEDWQPMEEGEDYFVVSAQLVEGTGPAEAIPEDPAEILSPEAKRLAAEKAEQDAADEKALADKEAADLLALPDHLMPGTEGSPTA